MTQPTPQIGADQPNITAPEALMISALLATGKFLPHEHGLSEDDLSCWERLWRFCTDYQARSGAAPGLELITAHFPDFAFIPGLDVNWAADQLHDASYGRHVRRNTSGMLQALGAGDYDAVSDAVQALAKSRRTHQLAGLGAFDPSNLSASQTKLGIPVPFTALADAATCIGFAELWTLAAYTGHGKSNMLPLYAAVAAEAGYHINYLSIEMPAENINRRIHRCHARGNRDMQLRLGSPDLTIRLAALEELSAKVPGSITTIDPSMARIDINTVADATVDKQLVMIDHVGLLQLADGTRGVEDWRAMAKISNMLHEIVLSTQTAMLNAAQTTKESDRAGMKAPKLSDIGGTIAIAQDSDVVITQRMPGMGFLSHALQKCRESVLSTWYTRYNPGNGDYREITREEAKILKLADEDRMAEA